MEINYIILKKENFFKVKRGIKVYTYDNRNKSANYYIIDVRGSITNYYYCW